MAVPTAAVAEPAQGVPTPAGLSPQFPASPAPPPPKRAPTTALTLRSKSMTSELEELGKARPSSTQEGASARGPPQPRTLPPNLYPVGCGVRGWALPAQRV